jgi:hypothetical protein
METITFETGMEEYVVTEILKKKLDEEDYLIEEDGTRVLSQDGTEVNIRDFGGFENGSEIFVKKDIVSLMNHLGK